MNFDGNPNLTCIQVDDKAYSDANWAERKDDTTVFSEDCDALIAYTQIPDTNFEQALIDAGHDTGAVDGKVPTDNIKTITSLILYNKKY